VPAGIAVSLLLVTAAACTANCNMVTGADDIVIHVGDDDDVPAPVSVRAAAPGAGAAGGGAGGTTSVEGGSAGAPRLAPSAAESQH
jgi:hypothetical protein